MNNCNILYILSRTVSKISCIVGQICAKFKIVKFNLKKLEKPPVVWCKAYFDILNRLGVIQECDGPMEGRTDRRTDITVANTALHYVAQPLR